MAQSVEAVLAKYLERTQSTSAKNAYKSGIDRVTENPMAKAADAEELYLARVTESVRNGKRRRKLLETPFQRWKENAKNKGADRLASGAAAAADKVRASLTKWLPVTEQVKSTIAAMPKGTREDSRNRMLKAMDMMMDAAGRD